MVFNDLVWIGMTDDGLELFGGLQNGLVWSGMNWYGLEWNGANWNGLAWIKINSLDFKTDRYRLK